jgi:hypothetical protein
VPVALLDPPAGVLAAVGAVAFVVALTQAQTYWLMYGLYTFSLVLLLAAPAKSASKQKNAASRSSWASRSSSLVCSSSTLWAHGSPGATHSPNCPDTVTTRLYLHRSRALYEYAERARR